MLSRRMEVADNAIAAVMRRIKRSGEHRRYMFCRAQATEKEETVPFKVFT